VIRKSAAALDSISIAQERTSPAARMPSVRSVHGHGAMNGTGVVIPASHVAMLSRPKEIAAVILAAAQNTEMAAAEK
jgi:hypothetical protein